MRPDGWCGEFRSREAEGERPGRLARLARLWRRVVGLVKIMDDAGRLRDPACEAEMRRRWGANHDAT